MLTELLHNIVQYGYILIFILVFLQEIGVPSFPNEIILFYFGALSRQHILFFPAVFIIAVSADITGTLLIYFLFYYGKTYLKKIIPSWLPIPYKKIKQLTLSIHQRGGSLLFIGRITPFLRGYISVASGLLHIPAKRYIPILFISALFWTGGWVTIGYILMPLLKIENLFNSFSTFGVTALIVVLILYILSFLNKQLFNTKVK